MSERPLQGLSILVLEDEFLIAMDIEEACRASGARAVTILSHVPASGEFDSLQGHDAAVLDLKLGGVSTLEAARLLAERGTPFVFATGYAADEGGLAGFPGIAVVGKPFAADDLVAALAGAVRANQAADPIT